MNGKLYIGVTKDPKHRKLCHFRGYDPERLISKAVEKYGVDNFSFDIICVGHKNYIYDLEPKAIVLYDSNAETGHGYNLCVGGLVNNQINKGKSIKTRADDKFVYVSGWWFPNQRLARKALNWTKNKYVVRKKNNTLGEVLHKEREIAVRSDDYNCYVAGFWFPNKRVACSKLKIDPSTFYKWKAEDTLGDVVHYRFSQVYDAPQYFAGFWFPNLRIASDIFGLHPERLYSKIRRGYVEEDQSIRNPKAAVGKWKIRTDFGLFESIIEVNKATGISRPKIAKNLNLNKEGFSYEFSYTN